MSRNRGHWREADAPYRAPIQDDLRVIEVPWIDMVKILLGGFAFFAILFIGVSIGRGS